jgi:hypothetical protein
LSRTLTGVANVAGCALTANSSPLHANTAAIARGPERGFVAM